jgi:hypothetical protein
MKKSIVFKLFLLLLPGLVMAYSGSSQITATRIISPLSAKYGDTISVTLTVAVGSITGTSLRGFYLTEYIPAGYSVAKDSAVLNGALINSRIKRESVTGQTTYTGFDAERWVLETPTAWTENNPITAMSTLAIKYKLLVPANAATQTIPLPGFSWVAMDPTRGDAGDVFGYEDSPPTLSITGSPAPVKIAVVSATASSTTGGNAAGNAIDGNAGTRWESAYTDNEWIAFDLGAQYNVKSVVFVWENASGKTYKIQGSNDATFGGTPAELYNYTAAVCGTKTDSLVIAAAGTYRYVRMLGLTRCLAYGYSIFEARIYGGQGGSVSAPPTVATAAAALPNPVAGTTSNLSVQGSDDGGEAGLTYTWTASGPATVTFSANASNAAKNCVATFLKSGSYTLTATIRDADNQTVTSAVSVSVSQTVTGVSVSPSSASVAINQTQQFTASASDQFGAVMSPLPAFTWTVSGGGTISVSGLFTAGATAGGPFTVTAAAGGKSASASVTVTAPNNPPTVATAAAASPNPVTASTTNLSVLGADDGGEVALTYTWATTGTPPAAVSFSANGTNAAKNTAATFAKAGSYTLQVTIKDAQNATVASSVTVTVNQTQTTLSVSPASATVNINAAQQFTANANDQFGAAISPQPAFSWVVSGGGTISASGLFTAGVTAGGPYTVTATAGSQNATASVTVTAVFSSTKLTIAAATASSVENAGTPASAAIDNNAGTRWASAFSDPQWITFDLGSAKTATRVVLVWEAASGKTYKIQGSNDAAFGTSTDLYSFTTATCGAARTDSLTLTTTGSFRYVRMLGQVRCTGYGYSIWEARIYGASAPFSLPPTVAAAASASPNPATGVTANLSVLGADDGGELALTYTWAATGTPPAAVSFLANGTNAAKSTVATFTKAGNYALQATIRDADGQSVTSSVAVMVNQTQTSASVSPAGATTAINTAQQFTATAKDQFGTALSVQPTFTWTVTGGGAISASGLFTAGISAGGPYTITATAGSLNATANVTVTASVASSKLTIAAATASSVENAGTPASAAIDNNAGTRWASAFSDPQWITFDLGAAKNISSVVFVWEAASGKDFRVQASNDVAFGGTPLELSHYTAAACAGRTDSLAVSSGGGYRYVRMLGATRCTGYGYSIWEARIYGF